MDSIGSEILRVLRKYWGYSSFLPLQRETVRSIMKGRDSLTVLPTGGGKSLCYQLPALLSEGMAVVVSPLISLMQDQVGALQDMGIHAAGFNSSMPYDLQNAVAEDIRKGLVKLLYVSPERLCNENMAGLLSSVKISFFVIDEAHCISHWGHDFRADYRNLSMIKNRFRPARVHAFTATATGKVQTDIIEQLSLEKPDRHIGPVDRPNLTYRVMPRKDLIVQIREILGRHSGEGGIIYCLRRKDVDSVSAELKNLGIDNVRYHAGMRDEERRLSQERFSREEVDVMVATIAFGMGIDRSNIRFIVHAGMPKSIENYQQETGRAGRDGLPASCYMFYSGGDYRLWSFFAENSSERDTMKAKLSEMYNFSVMPRCRHRALSEYFGDGHDGRPCGACDHCLSEMDMVEDPLIMAQKILSCVRKVRGLNYGFGAGYTVDVLKGKMTEKISRLGHDSLPVFGILKGETALFLRYMIEQLLAQGFLGREDEFGTLDISETGERLLRGEVTPVLIKPLVAEKKKEVSRRAGERRSEEWAEIDTPLFSKLRAKRTELASAKNVPPYIIFGDKTLRDIASKKPLTKEDFAGIYGVGRTKLESYADIFIAIVKKHCG